MAGTMIHLVIAVRLADFIEKNGYLIKTSIEEKEGTDLNRKMFVVGNICPDGIMNHKNYERSMKLHTHFRDGIPDGDFGKDGTIEIFEGRLKGFWEKHLEDEKYVRGLYLGYITHMMTDKRFVLYERPKYFENISVIGLTDHDRETFVYFNRDTDLVDFKLVREMPELLEAKDILEETSGYYIKDMITSIDLDKSRMWILNHFFEKEHVIEESRFLDYKSIIKFIDDTVEYIKKRLLDEKFLINRSRIEKQGNGG